MRRRLFPVLLLMLCLMAFCANALAEEVVIETEDIGDQLYMYGGFAGEPTGVMESSPMAMFAIRSASVSLEDYLYQQMMAGVERIDVSDYDLTYDQTTKTAPELAEAFRNAINKHGDLFFVDSSLRYSRQGTKVLSFIPKYNVTGTEREAMLERFNLEVDKIVSYALSCSEDDLGQVMAVNDYMCRHFQYDTDYKISDAYNFLTKGKGVCQAYMVTFSTVMQRLGIPSSYCESKDINHTWNAVQIDGQWYQIDVTWNDATPDRFGAALHSNLLMSATNSKTVHDNATDIVSSVSATSTKYDNYFWNSVDHSFVIQDNDYYYVQPVGDSPRDYQLMHWNSVSGAHTVVTTFRSEWPVPNLESTYYAAYFGSVGSYQGYLLYTTADAVYAVLPTGGTSIKIFSYSDANTLLYGGYFEDGVYHYATASRTQLDAKNYLKEVSRDKQWPVVIPGVVVPTTKPTTVPTTKPTTVPTAKPTTVPTTKPTTVPTAKPTTVPTAKPTTVPTTKPTTVPTAKPTAVPTAKPTTVPTTKPTSKPTVEPTAKPAAPVVVTQPKAQYVVEGQTATFEVAASGNGLKYQWYVNYNDGKGWRIVRGATSYRYTTSTVKTGNNGYQYYCCVTNSDNLSVNSDTVKLYVSAKPDTPSTGDSAMPILWGILVLVGCVGLIVAVRKIRKS